MGGAFVNISDEAGDSPLHWAIREGHPAIVKILLHEGADKNARNEDGETPLFFATTLQEAEVAQLLIASGARVSDVNNAGVSISEEAKLAGLTQVVNSLERNGAMLSKLPSFSAPEASNFLHV